MMPERFLAMWNNFEVIIMTLVSFTLGVIAFFATYAVALIAIVPSICSTLFWLNRIRHGQVRKYYDGSWWKWLKASLGFEKNNKNE